MHSSPQDGVNEAYPRVDRHVNKAGEEVESFIIQRCAALSVCRCLYVFCWDIRDGYRKALFDHLGLDSGNVV
jgi:hypothetical protein